MSQEIGGGGPNVTGDWGWGGAQCYGRLGAGGPNLMGAQHFITPDVNVATRGY